MPTVSAIAEPFGLFGNLDNSDALPEQPYEIWHLPVNQKNQILIDDIGENIMQVGGLIYTGMTDFGGVFPLEMLVPTPDNSWLVLRFPDSDAWWPFRFPEIREDDLYDIVAAIRDWEPPTNYYPATPWE